MLRILKKELERGLRSPTFYLGVAICLFIYGISFTTIDWINIVLYPNGTVVDRHNQFLIEFNPYRTLLPLSATLPLCASVAEDWEHRANYFITSRCSFANYCCAKFLSSGILGGSVLMIGLWCFLYLLKGFLPFYDEYTYYEPFIEPLLVGNQWLLYLAYWGSLQFLLGILCSSIGCVFATITTRRSLIYLCPMLLFAMLEIATNITIVGLSGGQSSIVFREHQQTPGHIYCLIAGILLMLTIISYGVFRIMLKRRIYEWQ